MGIIKEFKEFAVRGNMVDMAVGIIIGAAFGRVVNGLVSQILMPPLGLAMGEADFNDYKLVLRDAALGADGKITTPEVAISYGQFVSTMIDFLIVAIAVFILVKGVNILRRKQAEAPPPAPPAPTREEQLLSEIRDLLRART